MRQVGKSTLLKHIAERTYVTLDNRLALETATTMREVFFQQYPAPILIDEIQRGGISRHDSLLLNTHIAISHSLLEDTVIFYTIGIGLVWLLMPRILLAICAVWILRTLQMIFIRSKSLHSPAR